MLLRSTLRLSTKTWADGAVVEIVGKAPSSLDSDSNDLHGGRKETNFPLINESLRESFSQRLVQPTCLEPGDVRCNVLVAYPLGTESLRPCGDLVHLRMTIGSTAWRS
jgi:hypothetical protein